VLQRFKQREGDAREIFEDKWTVSEKIEFVLKIITERGSVRFAELFETAANRSEVVCTFLALLELIRLKQLACVQPSRLRRLKSAVPCRKFQRQQSNRRSPIQILPLPAS